MFTTRELSPAKRGNLEDRHLMNLERNTVAEQVLDEALRVGSIRQAYLVLDAARGIDLPAVALECDVTCRSLYTGRAGAMLADVAPYLLPLEPGSKLLRWFASRWGDHVGIMLQVRLEFDQAHKHLRSLLAVTTEADKKYLLRYYDPRVLAGLLDGADASQAEPFFGPVAAWHCQDLDGRHLLTFALQAKGVYVRKTPLQSAGDDRKPALGEVSRDRSTRDAHAGDVAAAEPKHDAVNRGRERVNRYRK